MSATDQNPESCLSSASAASSIPGGGVVYPRSVLSMLPTYAAGKPPVEVPGLTPYKLSSNENPWAPVPAVTEMIARAFTDGGSGAAGLCRYPDPLYTDLRGHIGATYGIDPEDVVVGAGSLGALTQLINTFAGTRPQDGAQDEVIFAWRSFEAYPIVVRTAGARDVQVPLTADGRHDLDAMAAAITERTRMILLCTPNNPTGPVLRTAEVEDFLTKVPSDVLVVIDEAYTEFMTDPQAVNGLEVFAKHPNVAVLRTFSKAHGLANLRIGYSVTHPELTQHLRVIATPFATSSLAEQAAITSLQNMDQVMERVNTVIAERERVLAELARLDIQVPETQANFYWLPAGDRTPELVEKGRERALALRGFGTEGARITIGEPEANDRMLELLSSLNG